MKEYLEQLIDGHDLSEAQAETMMTHIMSGDYTPAQIAGLLIALRIKGETVDEITGCARVMRDKATRVFVEGKDLLDTCGTGGDGGTTFNVSTTASIIAAASGMSIAKHGNRSVSSQCGSADVLEGLGIKIEMSSDAVADCINQVGIGFMFAPAFHQAMKYAITPRRELKTRTIFNILGPLTNPAHANHQIVGVFDASLLVMFAEVLKRLGTKRALVVHGYDHMDEISLCHQTNICELKADGSIETYTIAPEDFGLSRAKPEDVAGGSCEENVKIIVDILNGEKSAKRDLVCLNAGAALYVSGKAQSIKEGVTFAGELIDSGKAMNTLKKWQNVQ